MKHIIYFTLFVSISLFCASGCSSEFKVFIARNADTAIISCYSETSTSTTKESKVTSQEKINAMVGFISNEPSPFIKCGYNGSIDFMRNNKSILSTKIEFNTHPGCAHFIYVHNDTVYAKNITHEGIAFLTKICAHNN